MKMTNYITRVATSKWQRVYTDEKGGLFIRGKNKGESVYIRINNLPCGKNLMFYDGTLEKAR